MQTDFTYTTETLSLPYRRPVWQGGEMPILEPAEMAVHRVRVKVGRGAGAYHASRALSAELGVAPELIRRLLNLPDFSDRQAATAQTTLLIAADPGPFVAEEEEVLGVMRSGWPLDGQGEAWGTYEQAVYDEDPRNGWLIRLGFDICPLPFREPLIEATGQTEVLDQAVLHDFDPVTEGDRVYLREGEYIEASLMARLELQSPGQGIPWDHRERHQLYLGVPYVQKVVEDFRAGRPLPETWVRWNLAYAIRAAWFLRWRFGRDRQQADDLQAAAAFECSLFGEANHV